MPSWRIGMYKLSQTGRMFRVKSILGVKPMIRKTIAVALLMAFAGVTYAQTVPPVRVCPPRVPGTVGTNFRFRNFHNNFINRSFINPLFLVGFGGAVIQPSFVNAGFAPSFAYNAGCCGQTAFAPQFIPSVSSCCGAQANFVQPQAFLPQVSPCQSQAQFLPQVASCGSGIGANFGSYAGVGGCANSALGFNAGLGGYGGVGGFNSLAGVGGVGTGLIGNGLGIVP